MTRTPSPPVARRTRSKSPGSVQKTDTTAAGVGFASPRVAAKKRVSSLMSASPAAKVKKGDLVGSLFAVRCPLRWCWEGSCLDCYQMQALVTVGSSK